jgi:DNA-binding transcriptional MerR regulator
MQFTTADVEEITGLTRGTFQRWCELKTIIPAAGGEGHGNHRKFSLMQVIGLAIVAELRKSERGCARNYVADVVRGFGEMQEEQLLKKFEMGSTHLLTVYGTNVIMDGNAHGDMVNVQRIYHSVKRKIEAIAQKQANTVGRSRGIVS